MFYTGQTWRNRMGIIMKKNVERYMIRARTVSDVRLRVDTVIVQVYEPDGEDWW